MKDRSITPLPPADFTPEMGNYKTLQPFRYWCQKVLPLVYDDSLSYYELLCKVVDYLNKTMEDVETLHSDVTNLHTAYEELQSYVNNYFSTLDVQEEINNKLNKMASDGSLSALIAPFITENANPIFVDSVSSMTDHNKTYVLTTSGEVYTYSNSTNSFVTTGLLYNFNNKLFNENFGYLETGRDLNDLVTNSTYILLNTNDYVNAPNFENSGFLSVKNRGGNSDIIIQTFTELSSNKVFVRNNVFGTWTSWLAAYATSYGELNNNTDLNSLTANGFYRLNGNYTYVNTPMSGANGWLINVTSGKQTNVELQIFIESNTGVSHYRLNTFGKWGSWFSLSFNAYGELNNNTDLNSLTANGFYRLNGNYTYVNTPMSGANGWLINVTSGKQTNVELQIFIESNTGVSHYRLNTFGKWGSWFSLSFNAYGELDNNTNLNNLTANGFYRLNGNYTYINTPMSGANGWLINVTSGKQTNVELQIFIENNTGVSHYRLNVFGTWGSWFSLSFNAYGELDNNTDLNSLIANGLYRLNGNYTYSNVPIVDEKASEIGGAVKVNGFLFNVVDGKTTNLGFQIYCPIDYNKVYMRYNLFGNWSKWKVNNGYGYYYAFGDSITVGITSGDTGNWDGYPLYFGIHSNLISINKAVGGTAYLRQLNGRTAIDDIKDTDISNADLISLAFGRNDSYQTLGTSNDNSGSKTICGKLKEILDYIKTNRSIAQVVIITPTPTTQWGFDTVEPGGWSIDNMNTEFEKICDEYGCGLISYKQCTLCHSWSEYSEDGVHPNKIAYKRLTAYLTGQLSKYFICNEDMN